MMASESESDQKEDGYIRCLQISVFVYGIFNILIRGTELLLAIISTSVIIATYIAGINHPSSFHEYLSDEAKHVIWRGPFTNLFSMVSQNNTNNTTLPDSSIGMLTSRVDANQEKINLHIWSAYFLMKCITVTFAFLLVFSAKKFSYSGNLAWLSYSIPVLAQYLLQFILDLSLGDYFERELPSQIWQGVDIGFQILGVLTVSIFLHLLYHMDDRIQGIDRYNGFPASGINGDISITEIIDDDQRYK